MFYDSQLEAFEVWGCWVLGFIGLWGLKVLRLRVQGRGMCGSRNWVFRELGFSMLACLVSWDCKNSEFRVGFSLGCSLPAQGPPSKY